MHGLKDQDFEHEHMIERWPAALRAVAARNRRLQRRTEQFEIDKGVQPLQIVALGRQLGQPLVDIKETGSLFRHARHPLHDMT
jgi:hypothetical protein